MKPFNLELAKAGHPVITKDGRKAVINAFSKSGNSFSATIVDEDREWNYLPDGRWNGEENNPNYRRHLYMDDVLNKKLLLIK